MSYPRKEKQEPTKARPLAVERRLGEVPSPFNGAGLTNLRYSVLVLLTRLLLVRWSAAVSDFRHHSR